MSSALVHVVLACKTAPAELDAALARCGATARLISLTEACAPGAHRSADALVIVCDDCGDDAVRLLLRSIARRPIGTLLMCASDKPAVALPRRVPVSVAVRPGVEELAGRLAALIELRPSLRRRAPRRTRRAVHLAEHFTRQLELASSMQRELLPMRLPQCGPISFSAIYQPVEYVSGDLFDLQRIDEEHVAVAVADVAGHGMPAALLTMFVKRALLAPRGLGGPREAVPPIEVVSRLNEELSACSLPGCEFVALAYGLINVRTREVELVRAGLPYPLLRRRSGELQLLRDGGPLIGMLPEAEFRSTRFVLEPGDELLLYTDGVDQLLQLDVHAASNAAEVCGRGLASSGGRGVGLRATGTTDGREGASGIGSAVAEGYVGIRGAVGQGLAGFSSAVSDGGAAFGGAGAFDGAAGTFGVPLGAFGVARSLSARGAAATPSGLALPGAYGSGCEMVGTRGPACGGSTRGDPKRSEMKRSDLIRIDPGGRDVNRRGLTRDDLNPTRGDLNVTSRVLNGGDPKHHLGEERRAAGPRLVRDGADVCGEAASAGPPIDLGESVWFSELRRGLSDGIRRMAERHELLRRTGQALDDLTALTIRVDPS